MKNNSWKLNRWTVFGIGLVCFGAGSLVTARLMHVSQVRADSNRVFELRIYHVVPGKLPALESRFRDTTSKLLAKHDLKVVGDWVPEGCSRLGQYIRRYPGSSQPGGSEEELGRDDGRSRVSRSDEIRAGQQAGGKNRLDVHASHRLFAHEVAM